MVDGPPLLIVLCSLVEWVEKNQGMLLCVGLF